MKSLNLAEDGVKVSSASNASKQKDASDTLRAQIMSFGVVGAIGFAVNAGLVEWFTLTLGPLWAQALAFPVAVSVGWYLNRRYTFGASGRIWHQEWLRYLTANIAGWVVINSVYLFLIFKYPEFHQKPSLALLGGAVCGFALNFIFSKLFVFRHSRRIEITSEPKIDEKYYEVVKRGSLSERLMIKARKEMYSRLIRVCGPTSSDRIIDVGVSDIIELGDNMLERLFPHKENITACGLGEGVAFRVEFPQVNYMRINQSEPLPMADKTFTLAVSNAVLEHVGSVAAQKYFIKELTRVSKSVFLSVPNRFFPIEHHTGLPFFAWNDTAFKFACKLAKKDAWARDENLLLLDRSRLHKLMPENVRVTYGYTGLMLGPFSSNIYAHIEAQ